MNNLLLGAFTVLHIFVDLARIVKRGGEREDTAVAFDIVVAATTAAAATAAATAQ